MILDHESRRKMRELEQKLLEKCPSLRHHILVGTEVRAVPIDEWLEWCIDDGNTVVGRTVLLDGSVVATDFLTSASLSFGSLEPMFFETAVMRLDACDIVARYATHAAAVVGHDHASRAMRGKYQ